MDQILQSFDNRQEDVFTSKLLKIAHLALSKKEYELAKKVFNIMGHAFLSWNDYLQAYKWFKKLRDVSRMAQDLETSMYAYK